MSESLKTKVMEDLAKREEELKQIRDILEKIGELDYDANRIDEVKMDIRGAQLALYEVVKSEQQQIQGKKEFERKKRHEH